MRQSKIIKLRCCSYCQVAWQCTANELKEHCVVECLKDPANDMKKYNESLHKNDR